MSDVDEDPLLRCGREDKERAILLDEALNEISLFNLRLEESVKDKNSSNNAETTDSEKKEEINEEFEFSNGIKFFNEELFECSFNEELLIREFLANKIPITEQFGDETSLDHILDVLSYHNQSHCTWSGPVFKVVTQLCFQLLGTSQSRVMLHKILFCIIEALNNLKFSPLKLIAKLLPNVLKNMGGNIVDEQVKRVLETSNLSLVSSDISSVAETNETEKSIKMDTSDSDIPNSCANAKSDSSNQSSENNLASKKSIDVLSNFKSIVLVLSKVLFKEAEAKRHSNIPDSKLDQIFILILTAAQDPKILSSCILFNVKNCLQLILEKYTDDGYFREVRVQGFVEKIYSYWEENIPNAFNHTLACSVLTDLIPLSGKGQLIRSSLALLSIICCLSNDDVELRDDVSISYLADFCINNVDLFNNQTVSKLYSVLLMIDAGIEKPLRDEQDKHHLSRLIGLICSMQVAVSSTDPIKRKLDCLIKVLSSGWKRLLNPVSQRPMKQRSIDDFIKSDYRSY